MDKFFFPSEFRILALWGFVPIGRYNHATKKPDGNQSRTLRLHVRDVIMYCTLGA